MIGSDLLRAACMAAPVVVVVANGAVVLIPSENDMPQARAPRADAVRNRKKILDAARE